MESNTLDSQRYRILENIDFITVGIFVVQKRAHEYVSDGLNLWASIWNFILMAHSAVFLETWLLSFFHSSRKG